MISTQVPARALERAIQVVEVPLVALVREDHERVAALGVRLALAARRAAPRRRVDAVDVGLHGRDLRAAALALLGLVRQRVAPAEVQRREIARERGAEAIRQFDDGARGPGVHGRADEILARLVAWAAGLPLIQPDNMSLLVSHVRRQVPDERLALCGHFSRVAKLGVEARARHGRAAAGLRRVRDHGRVADDARPVPISVPAVRTVHEVVAVVHLGERLCGNQNFMARSQHAASLRNAPDTLVDFHTGECVAGSRQGDLRADARRYFTRKLVPKHHVDEAAPVHVGHDHERPVGGAARVGRVGVALPVPLGNII